MKTERDRLAIFNERVKLLAGFLSAIGLGLIGFAILRPLTEAGLVPGRSLLWGGAGLAFHAGAHYVLTWLQKDAPDDDV